MAHRLASKINRLIITNKKLIQHERLHSTKVNVESGYSKGVGSRTASAAKCKTPEDGVAKARDPEASGSGKHKAGELRPGFARSMTKFCGPEVVTQPPQVEVDVKPTTSTRRFPRSNTQNAVTQPLKLPRLANPFPEPVKVMMSDTVSDKEKADLMLAEMQMEQRFFQQQMHEQRHQHQPSQQVQQQREQGATNPYLSAAWSRAAEAEAEGNNASARREEPAELAMYDEARAIEPQTPLRKGKKAHVLDMYNMKRFYSTKIANDVRLDRVKQAEMILDTLRPIYPHSQLPKRPIVDSGSAEEKRFIKRTLKFLAQHKMQNSNKGSRTPFPSYCEVKTENRRPIFKDLLGSVRQHGTTSDEFCRRAKKIREGKPNCPRLKMKHCKRPDPRACRRVYPIPKCTKLEAPYPSYTDCMEAPFEDTFTECKICPWEVKHISYSKSTGEKDTKYYHTSTRHFSTHARAHAHVSYKKVRPCKNPNGSKAPCDYEKTAKEKDAARDKCNNSSSNKKFVAPAHCSLMEWIDKGRNLFARSLGFFASENTGVARMSTGSSGSSRPPNKIPKKCPHIKPGECISSDPSLMDEDSGEMRRRHAKAEKLVKRYTLPIKRPLPACPKSKKSPCHKWD